MEYPKFTPEGWNEEIPKINKEILNNAKMANTVIEGKVTTCDANYNLYVNLGDNITGVIPRNEIEYMKEKELPNPRMCTNKINKIVQFKVKEISKDDTVILSRRAVTKDAMNWVNKELKEGDKVLGIVKSIQPYGAFVEIGGGIVGLLHIEDISVARIKSPYERLKIGQKINIMIKSIDRKNNRIILTYKELLGTWEENIKDVFPGMIIEGIARETEKFNNGIFIELKPNLVGLAEYKPNIEYGQNVQVYVKNVIPDKKKIKLKIL